MAARGPGTGTWPVRALGPAVQALMTGWHEPDESRDSRPDLWGAAAEMPPPTRQDSRRRGFYEVISFTFLGYTFRPREAFDKTRQISFTGFLPGVSAGKLAEMSRRAQAWKLNRRTTLTLAELAKAINPVLAGWLAYFTRFYPTAVIPLCKRINRHLIRWARRKYKRLERSSKRSRAWLAAVVERAPGLFAHWKYCATT